MAPNTVLYAQVLALIDSYQIGYLSETPKDSGLIIIHIPKMLMPSHKFQKFQKDAITLLNKKGVVRRLTRKNKVSIKISIYAIKADPVIPTNTHII